MGDQVQRKFAVIVNGDNEPRHLENVERAAKAFRKEGFSKIIVARSEQEIKDRIQELRTQIDDDDFLAVYVTGHGEVGSKEEGCVSLPGGCFSFGHLAEEFKKLTYGHRFVYLDTCKSGNGLSHFAIDTKTTVVTAGSKGEDVSCGLLTPNFLDDGQGSIPDRFARAVRNLKNARFTPQIFSPIPMTLGGRILPGRFPRSVETIDTDRALQNVLKDERKGLKPGELALVMFSADWCGPCKNYLPTFEKLAQRYDGRFLMLQAKGKNGSEKEWMEKYGISRLPTLAWINAKGRAVPIGPSHHQDPLADLSAHVSASIATDAERIERYRMELRTQERQSDAGFEEFKKILKKLKDFGEQTTTLVPDLIQLLDDKNPLVVQEAIIAMSGIGSKAEAALPILDRIRKGKSDTGLAKDALYALSKIVPPNHSLALALLQDLSVPAEFASSMLKRFGEDSRIFVSRLKEMARHPTESKIRIRAVTLLGGATGAEAFSDLKALLKDRDPALRTEAAKALRWMTNDQPALLEQVKHLLDHPDPMLRVGAIRILRNEKDFEAVSRKLAALFLKEKDPLVSLELTGETYRMVRSALEHDPDQAREILNHLRSRMRDAQCDPELRAASLKAYWGYHKMVDHGPNAGKKLNVTELMQLLRDPHPSIRSAAVWSLGDARGSLDPDQRAEAARTVIKLVEDPSPEIRRSAVRGLSYFAVYDLASSVSALAKALKDVEISVRQEAVTSLYDLSKQLFMEKATLSPLLPAVPAAISLLEDGSVPVEHTLELILVKLPKEGLKELMSRTGRVDVRRRIAAILPAHFGYASLYDKFLQDTDKEVILKTLTQLPHFLGSPSDQNEKENKEALMGLIPSLEKLLTHPEQVVRLRAREVWRNLPRDLIEGPRRNQGERNRIGMSVGAGVMSEAPAGTHPGRFGGRVSVGYELNDRWEIRGNAELLSGDQHPAIRGSIEPVAMFPLSPSSQFHLSLPGLGGHHVFSEKSGLSIPLLGAGIKYYFGNNQTGIFFAGQIRTGLDLPFGGKASFSVNGAVGIGAGF